MGKNKKTGSEGQTGKGKSRFVKFLSIVLYVILGLVALGIIGEFLGITEKPPTQSTSQTNPSETVQESSALSPYLKLQLVSESSMDIPVKASWTVKYHLDTNMNGDQIKEQLIERLKKIWAQYKRKKIKNWRYNKFATMITIYVYDDDKIAQDPEAAHMWIAQLTWNKNLDKEPQILFQSMETLSMMKKYYYAKSRLLNKYGGKQKLMEAMMKKLQTGVCAYTKKHYVFNEVVSGDKIADLVPDLNEDEKYVLGEFMVKFLDEHEAWVVYEYGKGIVDNDKLYWVDAMFESIQAVPDVFHIQPAIVVHCP